MEFIVNSLKQLATNISTSDIIVLIALVGILIFYVVKYVIKYRDFISGIFKANGDKIIHEKLVEINSQFDDVATSDDVKRLMDTLGEERLNILRIINQTSEEINRIKITLLELNTIKETLEREQESLGKNIDQVKSSLSSHEHTTEHNYSMLLAQLNKNHDAVVQAVSRIEKIDEFIKSAVPEFRTYHRELNNEVRDLNRDVALIGLQTSMNSGANPIKLR